VSSSHNKAAGAVGEYRNIYHFLRSVYVSRTMSSEGAVSRVSYTVSLSALKLTYLSYLTCHRIQFYALLIVLVLGVAIPNETHNLTSHSDQAYSC